MIARELMQSERAIDDAIAFGRTLAAGAPERALIARHICVLAAGYLENIVRVRLSEFMRQVRPRREIACFTEVTVDRFQNADFVKIVELTSRFSDQWRQELEAIDPSFKDAITSIVANRHLIAHGKHSGISFSQIEGYVASVKNFRREYERICT